MTYHGAVEVAFRRATRRDSAVAMQLVDRALREYGLHAVPDAGDIDLTDLEHHYDARGGCFELIEAGGEVIGVVGWRPAGDGVIELKKLYLASSAQNPKPHHSLKYLIFMTNIHHPVYLNNQHKKPLIIKKGTPPFIEKQISSKLEQTPIKISCNIKQEKKC